MKMMSSRLMPAPTSNSAAQHCCTTQARDKEVREKASSNQWIAASRMLPDYSNEAFPRLARLRAMPAPVAGRLAKGQAASPQQLSAFMRCIRHSRPPIALLTGTFSIF